MLAHASKAVIFGYDVVTDDRARQLADQLGVEVRLYRVIYEIVGDVIKAMQGLLEPELRYEVRGKVEIRKIFNVSRIGTVAGCIVTDGVIQRSHKVRLIRDGRIVQENLSLNSLKRFKDDVREVRAGIECGVKLEGYDDVKPGDVLEAVEVIEVAPQL
jgi:translation initiation factor IF-2